MYVLYLRTQDSVFLPLLALLVHWTILQDLPFGSNRRETSSSYDSSSDSFTSAARRPLRSRNASEMQSVFSRAAQAHLCNCRPCVQASQTMIRRSATATARRKATATDIFTACYTTILGTAAVADAHYKQNRSNELDRRLDEARSGLASLTDESTAHIVSDMRGQTQTLQLAMPELPNDPLAGIRSIHDRDDRLSNFQRRSLNRRNVLLNAHRTIGGNKSLDLRRVLPSLRSANLDSIEEAMEQEEETHTNFPQNEELLTRGNTLYLSKTIDQLVDALVMEVYRRDHPDDPEATRLSLESLDSVWTALRLLKSEGYPRYIHSDLDVEHRQKARQELNRLNRDVFSQWHPSRAKFLVGKLGYNLLVPPVAPTLHTFNALILGFTRVGEHTLSQIVVDCMVRQRSFCLTTQTIVCLLTHYRAKNDIDGFYSIIQSLMCAEPQRFLARRFVQDREEQSYLWNYYPDHWPWASPLMKGDTHVYDAMINGLLYFERVRDAVKVFLVCMEARCSFERQTLLQLIKYCLSTLDRVAAGLLVRGFLDNYKTLVSVLMAPDCPRKLSRRIHLLLHLVRRRSSTQDTPTALNPETQQNYLRLSTAVFIKETEGLLDRLGDTLHIAQRKLVNPNLALYERANSILDGLDKIQRQATMAETEAARYDSMMLYYDVQTELMRPAMQRLWFEGQLVNILCQFLPRRSYMRKVLQSRHIPLAIRLGWYQDKQLRARLHVFRVHVSVHKALFISTKVMDEFREPALTLLSLEESHPTDDMEQSFSEEDIPVLAIMARLRAAIDSNHVGCPDTDTLASRIERTLDAGKSVKRQQPVSYHMSWQANCI